MAQEGDDVIAGRYVIERELGRGGMATVYLARDLTLGRHVALKVLHPEISTVMGGGRFAREIQIASRLQHPGIVSLIDSGEANGRPFFTMPVIEGETLAQKLEREGQLPVGEAVSIASAIADALSFAHAQGVLHRDIKPANVLMSGGHPLITDFGVARALDTLSTDRLTESGATVGTAHYMSPEQASADKVDERSDIYALGCVLYEMLAGTPPFTGATTQAVLARHAVDRMPSLRTVRTPVTHRLENVIAKALEKVPADRYSSAAEFRAALLEAANSNDDDAPAPSRRRAAIGAAIAIVIVAAGVTARMLWPAALDQKHIVSFPLYASGPIGSMKTPGEDVASLIASALDNRDSIHVTDGWNLLDPADRGSRRIVISTMQKLAIGASAGHFVTGAITSLDSATVQCDVELRDSRTGKVIEKASSKGAPGDLWRVAIRAINQLLPEITKTQSRDFEAAWADRDPGAVALFFAGESAYRRTQYHAALDNYLAAFRADSNFVLAAVRGAQAATADHHADQAALLVRSVLDKPMAPQFHHFTLGYDAYLTGAADSAIREFGRALAVAPNMSSALAQLGETYIHLVTSAENPDSLARDAFDRARAIDSSSVHLLLHPIEIALRARDLRAAAPLIGRFLAAKPDSSFATEVRVMDACVRDGPSRVQWDAEVRTNPAGTIAAALAMSAHGALLDCSAAAYAAVIDGDTASANPLARAGRQSALVGLLGVLVAQGKGQEAAGRIARSVARGDGGSSLLMVAAPVDPSMTSAAAAVAANDSARFGADYGRCSGTERCWILSVFIATQGKSFGVDTIAAWLSRRTTRDSTREVQLLAKASAAHALLAHGDSAGAREAFQKLLAEPIPSSPAIWDPGGALGAERLVYARLALAKGDLVEARRVANGFDSPAPASYALYLRKSLELRAQIADLQKESGAAGNYRTRLSRLDTR